MNHAVIVVADDEALQRETLADVLVKAGHRVVPVPNGEAAVEAVDREAVDLVITDLRMPGISGLEVVQQVKARQPDVAVVVLTAFGTVEGAVEP